MKPSERISQLIKTAAWAHARTILESASTGAVPFTDEEWDARVRSDTVKPDLTQMDPGQAFEILTTYLDEQDQKMARLVDSLRSLAEAEESERKASIIREMADRLES